MPLFYQQHINDTTRLAIWKIEEDEEFFLRYVPLQQEITHPHKRLQHLAARYLLRFLFPDFPNEEILVADTRKPYLPNEQYHFSVSHCGNYAAALVSSDHRVGIDIEKQTEKIERIAHKFMHENDLYYIATSSLYDRNTLQLLAMMWSAKESLYKWYGLGDVNFKEHMQLNGGMKQDEEQFLLPFVFKKHHALHVTVYAKVFEDIVLDWIATK